MSCKGLDKCIILQMCKAELLWHTVAGTRHHHMQVPRSIVSAPLLLLAAVAGSAAGGTLDNMPLEQLESFRGRNARGNPKANTPHHQGLADVYSAGIALWSLIVGQPPLQGLIMVRHRKHPQHHNVHDCSRCTNYAHRLKYDLVSPCYCMLAQLTCIVYLHCAFG